MSEPYEQLAAKEVSVASPGLGTDDTQDIEDTASVADVADVADMADVEDVEDDKGERFLVFPLYCRVGIFNQWISLQLACVLANLTDRTLVLDLDFGFVSGGARKEMFAHSGNSRPSDVQITDLFDVCVSMRVYRNMAPFDAFMASAEAAGDVYTPPHDAWPTCFLNAVVCVEDDVDENDEHFRQFRHGRRQCVQLTELTGRPERVLRLRRAGANDPPTFNFATPVSLVYSRVAGVRANVARVAASVRPKRRWLDAAHTLATTQLGGGGTFDAVHLRRGDKLRGNPYIQNLTGEWLVEQLRSTLYKSGKDDRDGDGEESPERRPLIVCTDSPHDPLITAVREAFPSVRLMDDVLEQAQHRGEVLVSDADENANASLCSDRIVKAFVSALACTFAHTFMGTQGSTFSSYINHVRGVRGVQHELAYCYPDRCGGGGGGETRGGMWSWTRRNAEPRALGWFVVHPEEWIYINGGAIVADGRLARSRIMMHHSRLYPPAPTTQL